MERDAEATTRNAGGTRRKTGDETEIENGNEGTGDTGNETVTGSQESGIAHDQDDLLLPFRI